MKVAFVSTMAGYAWGGSEVLWSETSRVLVSQGHEVHVGYRKLPVMPAPVQALVDDFGIQIFHPSEPGSLARRIGRGVAQALGAIPRINRERAWLRRVRPDLLCISGGIAFEEATWMDMAITEHIPFVTLTHANAEYLWPGDNQANWLNTLYRAARRCFFVSRGNLSLIEKQLGARLENAEVVSNQSATVWGLEAPWPSNDDGIWRLASVGRLHPVSKGQDLLMEVLRQEHWRKRPLTVSLYGTGPHEQSLRRLVDLSRLEHHISFCGHVNDVARIWGENHALILPSRIEGLPLVLIEAMMCGRTAIVTDVAGNAEVVEHGITGFIADAPAVRPLARAMEEAWEARDRWREMGQRARESIRRLVHKDPPAVFAERLLQLAGLNHG